MQVKGKNILVVGGAGFIGSHVVDALVPENAVTVADNLSSGKWQNIAHHIEQGTILFVKADIRDEDRMNELVRGKDIVFHLAVQCLRVSLNDPQLVHEVNATGTLNLCMAALGNGVERFVYVSSSEVYGTAKRVPMDEEHPLEPTTPYGASKLAGEAYARAYYLTYGLPVVIVRPFNTYGPREPQGGPYGEVIPRFVARVLTGRPPVIFGDGGQTRDFTEVSDTARGIVLASECDALVGETINVAAGQEVSINQIAHIVLRELGQEAQLAPTYMEARPGDVRRHWADISRARQAMKFEPTINIDEGIRRYIDWLKAQNLDLPQLEKDELIMNWLSQPKEAIV